MKKKMLPLRCAQLSLFFILAWSPVALDSQIRNQLANFLSEMKITNNIFVFCAFTE